MAKARNFHARVPFGGPRRIACGLEMAGDEEHQRPRHQEGGEAGETEQAEGGRRLQEAEPDLVADQRHRDPEQDGDEYRDPDRLDAPPVDPAQQRRSSGEQPATASAHTVGTPWASRIRTVSHGSATSTKRLRPRNRNGLTAPTDSPVSVMISSRDCVHRLARSEIADGLASASLQPDISLITKPHRFQFETSLPGATMRIRIITGPDLARSAARAVP